MVKLQKSLENHENHSVVTAKTDFESDSGRIRAENGMKLRSNLTILSLRRTQSNLRTFFQNLRSPLNRKSKIIIRPG